MENIEPFTVKLPKELQQPLKDLGQEEGVSVDELIARSVKDYLFIKKFRKIQNKWVPRAQKMGIRSEEDVLKALS